jgi:integrase
LPTVHLTQNFINNLTCPEGKSKIEYGSDDLPNFFVECRQTSPSPGRGTYWVRYRAKGADGSGNRKNSYQRIGLTTEMDLATAKARAKQVLAEVSLGRDFRGEVKAQKAVMTLNTFWVERYAPFASARKRSFSRDRQLFSRLRDAFGDRRLNAITRFEMIKFHNDLLASGLSPQSADHHARLIRRMYSLAVEWELITANPFVRFPMFNVDNKVEHILDEKQLERLLHVLRTDENRTVCHIATFLLSTGARLNEALTAKWSEVDIARRVWRIAALNSKSKRVRSVPLNDSAIAVLETLDTSGKFEHLFINKQTGLPYTTIQKVWDRLRKKAGVPHTRIHDLRHWYASRLVDANRTLYEVQAILGHSSPIVTQRYAHLSTKTLQDAANTASVLTNRTAEAAKAA